MASSEAATKIYTIAQEELSTSNLVYEDMQLTSLNLKSKGDNIENVHRESYFESIKKEDLQETLDVISSSLRKKLPFKSEDIAEVIVGIKNSKKYFTDLSEKGVESKLQVAYLRVISIREDDNYTVGYSAQYSHLHLGITKTLLKNVNRQEALDELQKICIYNTNADIANKAAPFSHLYATLTKFKTITF